MNIVKSPKDIKNLGTILAVWAHPDDETYCAGGLLAQAAKNGQKIICITATKGEKGIQDAKRWPPEKLADIRAAELKKACKILGISEHTWLDMEDGECKWAAARGLEEVQKAAAAHKPDSILTFGPDGLTGHLDHQAVSAWAIAAGKALQVPVYCTVMTPLMYSFYHDACEAAAQKGAPVDDMFFNIDQPPLVNEEDCAIHFELSEELWQKKLAALRAMPSQTEKLIAQLGEEYYRHIFRSEAFVRAK